MGEKKYKFIQGSTQTCIKIWRDRCVDTRKFIQSSTRTCIKMRGSKISEEYEIYTS